MATQGVHLGKEFQTCEKDIQPVEKDVQQVERDIQPVEKDIQPVERDIQPVEKDIQPTENAIISLKNRDNIRRGVEKQLNKRSNHKYNVISYTNSDKTEKDPNNDLGDMQLISNESQVFPKFSSEKNGNMYLGYKDDPTFVYTVNLCQQKETNSTKFIYSWNNGVEYYVAAPYFARNSSVVLCTCQLNITEAVNSKKPIKKISKRLNKLKLRNSSRKPFGKDKYIWYKDSNDNNFSIHSFGERCLYWKVGKDKDNEGKMLQTDEKSQKANLKFLQY